MTRWVLVTGGAVRLGREICLAFAQAGWAVACHYRHSADAAQALAATLRQQGIPVALVGGALDSVADAERLMADLLPRIDGVLHCVVNNASLFDPDSASDFTEDTLLAQMRTNLIVPLALGRLLHASLPADLPDGQASVVQILDQKVFNLNPDYYSYTLSKLALERSVAQQAQALAPRLRVNGVAPGLMYLSGPQSQDNFNLASQANLLRRAIDPAQVAQAAQFLAGNPCITGACLNVDNGQHLVPVPRDIMFLVDDLLQRQRNDLQ